VLRSSTVVIDNLRCTWYLIVYTNFMSETKITTANIVRPTVDDVNFLTVGQVAATLQVSRSFVVSRLPELGAFRCGRVYRVPLSCLDRFVSTNRVPPGQLPLQANPGSVIARAVRAARRKA
jgi:hypothetical protein